MFGGTGYHWRESQPTGAQLAALRQTRLRVLQALQAGLEGSGTGATVTGDGRVYHGAGFAVGGAGPSLHLPGITSFDSRSEQVVAWLAQVHDGTPRNPEGSDRRHYGVWLDKDAGELIFDVVDVFDNAERAAREGLARGEKAIYDFAGKQEIRVKASSA